MPGGIEHRGASGFITSLRVLLRGGKRPIENGLRFADLLAARTQPPPDIPGGPYHKTSKIYYYTRDGRREVEPPTVISTNQQIATSGHVEVKARPTTPGKVFHC